MWVFWPICKVPKFVSDWLKMVVLIWLAETKLEITTNELIGDEKQIYITYQSFPT